MHARIDFLERCEVTMQWLFESGMALKYLHKDWIVCNGVNVEAHAHGPSVTQIKLCWQVLNDLKLVENTEWRICNDGKNGWYYTVEDATERLSAKHSALSLPVAKNDWEDCKEIDIWIKRLQCSLPRSDTGQKLSLMDNHGLAWI